MDENHEQTGQGYPDHIYDQVYDEAMDNCKATPSPGAADKHSCVVPEIWLDRLLPSTEPMSGIDWQSVFGRVFILEDDGVFRPMAKERLVMAGEKEAEFRYLSGNFPYNLGDILQQFTSLPLWQIHHFANTGEYLRVLFTQRQLIDVLIHVKEKLFAAHRVALACHSVYFARIFILNQHQKNKLTEVRLKNVDAYAFYAALKFIYSGTLMVNDKNVESLIKVANQLQIPAVMYRCLDFLGHMPVQKVKEEEEDEELSHVTVITQARPFLESQLGELLHNEKFLGQPVQVVEMILGNDSAMINSELEVLNAALAWLAFDLGPRRRHTERVMRNVRFSCMTLAEIIEASQVNDIIRHSSFCRNRVLEAVWLMTLKGYKTHDVFGCPCPKPRQHLQNKGPQLPVVVETINVDSLQQGQDVSNHANGLRASGNCSMLDSVEMGDFCKPVARPAYPQETSQSSFHQQRHDSFPVYQCGDASLNKPGKMPRRHQVPSSISLGMNILYPGNPVAQDNFCQSAGDGLGLDQLSTNTVRQSRSGASKAKGPGAAPASVPSKPAPSLRDGGHRQASQMSLPPMKRVSSKSSIYSDKYAPPRQSRPPSSSRMSVPDTSSGKFRDSSASKSPQSLHRQPSNSSRTTPETTKSLAYPIRNMYFGPKKSVQKVPIISVSRGTSSASIIPPPPPPPPPPPSPPPLPPPVEFEDVPSFKFFSSRLSGEGYEGDMCGVEVSFEQRAVSPSRDSQPASDLQVEPETSAGGMSGTSVEWREGDLLAVGGFVDSSNKVGSSMAHVLDSRQQKWEKLSQIPETRLNFAAAFLKNTLCICGGYDPHRNEAGTRATTDMFMFNKGDQKWVQGGNMLYARAFHAVCVLGGRLFALGGQDQDDRALKTVEVYDPEADRWSLVCSMTACRVGACATAFQGRVMVVGGYGESSDYSSEPCPVLLTTEWFEPAINRWLARGSLRLPRAQACLVAAGPYLYLCGGATRDPSSGTLCSIPDIDRYNPDTDQWIRLTNLEVARHNAGATAIGTKIYVVGGVSTDLNQVLRSVECFDTSTNRWDTSLPELPLGAKSLACIVIAG